MACLVDSSVWVALFLDFYTHHVRAGNVMQKLGGVVYMPYCVIAEVATVLAYKHSKRLADNFIAYIRDTRDITVIDDDTLEEMESYATIADTISFVDSSLIFLSGKLGARLVTFDKQLARIAKAVL